MGARVAAALPTARFVAAAVQPRQQIVTVLDQGGDA